MVTSLLSTFALDDNCFNTRHNLTSVCYSPPLISIVDICNKIRKILISVCESPMLISNGEFTISTDLRSAKYICDVGYVLVGSESRTCQDDGTGWDGIDPVCGKECWLHLLIDTFTNWSVRFVSERKQYHTSSLRLANNTLPDISLSIDCTVCAN